MANPKGSSEKKVELMLVATDMRMSGMSYRQIGRQLDVSHVTAYRYVEESIAQIREECDESAKQLLVLELKRLDAALAAIFKKVIGGDLNAIDRMIKIGERRSRLIGLDAPTKQQMDLNIPEPIEYVSTKEKNEAD